MTSPTLPPQPLVDLQDAVRGGQEGWRAAPGGGTQTRGGGGGHSVRREPAGRLHRERGRGQSCQEPRWTAAGGPHPGGIRNGLSLKLLSLLLLLLTILLFFFYAEIIPVSIISSHLLLSSGFSPPWFLPERRKFTIMNSWLAPTQPCATANPKPCH